MDKRPELSSVDYIESSIFTSRFTILALLAGGLAVSSVWGIWLWSKCLRNQSGNPQTIPFLTCLWPAGCFLILGG